MLCYVMLFDLKSKNTTSDLLEFEIYIASQSSTSFYCNCDDGHFSNLSKRCNPYKWLSLSVGWAV